MLFLPAAIHAQAAPRFRSAEFPFMDTSEARSSYARAVRAPLGEVVDRSSEVLFQRTNGRRVQYQVITEGDGVYQIFSIENDGIFSVDGAGTFIIKRNRDTGVFEQVKIFLLPDADFFVRVFPDEIRGSRMDVVLAGDRIHQNIRVPIEFQRVLTEPFDSIVRLTRHVVDWNVLREQESLNYRDTIIDLAREYRDAGELSDAFRTPREPEVVPVGRLRSFLFFVYQQEPGSVVTGSIFPSQYRTEERLTGEIVIFPYVDRDGSFRMVAFAEDQLVSVHSLVAQFSDNFFEAVVLSPDAFSFF